MYTVEVVHMLEDILNLESVPTANNLHSLLQHQKLSVRLFIQDKQQIPTVSEAQLRQALLVVQKDYWGLNC